MADGAAAPDASWYYLDHTGSKEARGPVSAHALGSARVVWRDGMPEWLPPSAVPEVAAAVRAAGAAPPSLPTAAPAPSKWYYQRADKSVAGPLGVGDLQAAMLAGDVDGMTAVWKDGMGAWLELREVPQLKAMFVAAQAAADAEQEFAASGGAADDGAPSQLGSADTAALPRTGGNEALVNASAAARPGRPAPAAGAGAPAADGPRRRSKKRKFKAHNPSSVYVSNLPPSVDTPDALAALFEPCGVIKSEPLTGERKVKLYRGADGLPKGDGVVTFVRKESVDLALELRHGYMVPDAPPSAPPLSVERARFELKGAYEPTTLNKDDQVCVRMCACVCACVCAYIHVCVHASVCKACSMERCAPRCAALPGAPAPCPPRAAAQARSTPMMRPRAPGAPPRVQAALKQRRQLERRKLAVWEDGLSTGGKEVRVVILKHAFDPAEVRAAAVEGGEDEVRAAYANLRDDLLAEAAKCGPVEKVTVFEGHPEGVAAVKFRTGAAAEVCQALMSGRRFGGRALEAEFFDGQTNYKAEAMAAAAADGAHGDAADAEAAAGGTTGQPEPDSYEEQKARLEAMAAQLDGESSSEEDDYELEADAGG